MCQWLQRVEVVPSTDWSREPIRRDHQAICGGAMRILGGNTCSQLRVTAVQGGAVAILASNVHQLLSDGMCLQLRRSTVRDERSSAAWQNCWQFSESSFDF
jgi:hypothetical protein